MVSCSCWPLRYLRIVFWALRVTIIGSFRLCYSPRPFLYAPSASIITARTSSRDIQLPECVWRRSAWNTVLQLCAADAAAGSAASSESFELDGNATTTLLMSSTTRTVPPPPDNDDSNSCNVGAPTTTTSAMMIHHTALHTRNITTAIRCWSFKSRVAFAPVRPAPLGCKVVVAIAVAVDWNSLKYRPTCGRRYQRVMLVVCDCRGHPIYWPTIPLGWAITTWRLM
jgi:hypothetical protein